MARVWPLADVVRTRLVTRGRLTAPLLLAVSAGGACGAVLRWWLGTIAPEGTGFPWTTFAINVSGSLLLALLPALATHRVLVAGLGPGLLGGFTTLSAYADQSRALLADDRALLAGAYLLGTLAACLAAVHLAHLVTTAHQRARFDAWEGNE